MRTVLVLVLFAAVLLVAAEEATPESAAPVVDSSTPDEVTDDSGEKEKKPIHLDQDLLIAYCALGVMALGPIWIGAHQSLVSIGPGGVPPEVDGKKQPKAESMSEEDAKWFPIVGSGVLFSLYCAFKLLDKELVNLLLTAYFVFLGVVALAWAFVKPALMKVLPASTDASPFKFSIPWRVWSSTAPASDFEFTTADVISIAVSSVFGAWYAVEKHWVANNIIGLAFSVEGVELLSLGKYTTGCILLGGLFFYDIFWVFGTEVMVSVAKGLEAPVKLLFPRSISNIDPAKMSMLGLGDIVIPGVFIALLLRFDAHRAGRITGFAKTHFHATFFAYFVGLFLTVFVMHTFQAAQPALLYLVPACVGVSFLVASASGTLKDLLAYDEQDKEEKKEEAKSN